MPHHFVYLGDGETRCLDCDCRAGGSASRERCVTDTPRRASSPADFQAVAQTLDRARRGLVQEGTADYARLQRLAAFLLREDAATATLGEAVWASNPPPPVM